MAKAAKTKKIRLVWNKTIFSAAAYFFPLKYFRYSIAPVCERRERERQRTEEIWAFLLFMSTIFWPKPNNVHVKIAAM